MCKIISLDDYRNNKQEKAENSNSYSDEELTKLEEPIWQMCQVLGLDQFFINLFSDDIPEREDTEGDKMRKNQKSKII